MNKILYFLFVIILFSYCLIAGEIDIVKINNNTLVHISYLKTESWGDVPCNGAVAYKDGEAVILDTPIDSASSLKLIRYVKDSLDCEIKYLIINHFHVDCIGGIKEFKRLNIPIVMSNKTFNIIEEDNYNHLFSFEDELEINLNDYSIYNYYLGPAHTSDNIISYIPDMNVLFGGCMVKSLGSGKGNLADADTLEWSNTVSRILPIINDSTIVIPGHGDFGNKELIEYTIKMFDNSKK